MLRSFALAFAMFTLSCTTTMPRETPRDAVQRFMEAFNQLDAAQLRPLFAEDATAFLPMPQHGARVEGREAILEILAPLLAADRERRKGEPLSLEAKELAIRQRGDVAVATFDVGAATVHSRRTLVLERQGGRWVIVHLHASNLSVPQASIAAEDL